MYIKYFYAYHLSDQILYDKKLGTVIEFRNIDQWTYNNWVSLLENNGVDIANIRCIKYFSTLSKGYITFGIDDTLNIDYFKHFRDKNEFDNISDHKEHDIITVILFTKESSNVEDAERTIEEISKYSTIITKQLIKWDISLLKRVFIPLIRYSIQQHQKITDENEGKQWDISYWFASPLLNEDQTAVECKSHFKYNKEINVIQTVLQFFPRVKYEWNCMIPEIWFEQLGKTQKIIHLDCYANDNDQGRNEWYWEDKNGWLKCFSVDELESVNKGNRCLNSDNWVILSRATEGICHKFLEIGFNNVIGILPYLNEKVNYFLWLLYYNILNGHCIFDAFNSAKEGAEHTNSTEETDKFSTKYEGTTPFIFLSKGDSQKTKLFTEGNTELSFKEIYNSYLNNKGDLRFPSYSTQIYRIKNTNIRCNILYNKPVLIEEYFFAQNWANYYYEHKRVSKIIRIDLNYMKVSEEIIINIISRKWNWNEQWKTFREFYKKIKYENWFLIIDCVQSETKEESKFTEIFQNILTKTITPILWVLMNLKENEIKEMEIAQFKFEQPLYTNGWELCRNIINNECNKQLIYSDLTGNSNPADNERLKLISDFCNTSIVNTMKCSIWYNWIITGRKQDEDWFIDWIKQRQNQRILNIIIERVSAMSRVSVIEIEKILFTLSIYTNGWAAIDFVFFSSLEVSSLSNWLSLLQISGVCLRQDNIYKLNTAIKDDILSAYENKHLNTFISNAFDFYQQYFNYFFHEKYYTFPIFSLYDEFTPWIPYSIFNKRNHSFIARKLNNINEIRATLEANEQVLFYIFIHNKQFVINSLNNHQMKYKIEELFLAIPSYYFYSNSNDFDYSFWLNYFTNIVQQYQNSTLWIKWYIFQISKSNNYVYNPKALASDIHKNTEGYSFWTYARILCDYKNNKDNTEHAKMFNDIHSIIISKECKKDCYWTVIALIKEIQIYLLNQDLLQKRMEKIMLEIKIKTDQWDPLLLFTLYYYWFQWNSTIFNYSNMKNNVHEWRDVLNKNQQLLKDYENIYSDVSTKYRGLALKNKLNYFYVLQGKMSCDWFYELMKMKKLRKEIYWYYSKWNEIEFNNLKNNFGGVCVWVWDECHKNDCDYYSKSTEIENFECIVIVTYTSLFREYKKIRKQIKNLIVIKYNDENEEGEEGKGNGVHVQENNTNNYNTKTSSFNIAYYALYKFLKCYVKYDSWQKSIAAYSSQFHKFRNIQLTYYLTGAQISKVFLNGCLNNAKLSDNEKNWNYPYAALINNTGNYSGSRLSPVELSVIEEWICSNKDNLFHKLRWSVYSKHSIINDLINLLTIYGYHITVINSSEDEENIVCRTTKSILIFNCYYPNIDKLNQINFVIITHVDIEIKDQNNNIMHVSIT